MQINNQSPTCLITGCSGYIGSFIAKKLINLNWHVSGITRQIDTSKLNPQVHWIVADLKDQKSDLEISKMLTKYGALDAIIHCAGFSPDFTILNLEEDKFQLGLTLNFSALQKLNQTLTPMLNQNGAIIHFGSRVSTVGNQGQIAYATAKGILTDYTKRLAAELGPKKITVNLILPGVHPSEILGPHRQQIMENAQKSSLLNQLTNIEDVVNAVIFLLNARSVTGQVLSVESRLLE